MAAMRVTGLWDKERKRDRKMLALLKELGPELELRGGAGEDAIAQAERAVGWTFPAEYSAFLRVTNGAMGFLASGDYVDLWPVEALLERNQAYQFPERCREVVAFGSNGGGEAYDFIRSVRSGIISPIAEVVHSVGGLTIGSSYFLEIVWSPPKTFNGKPNARSV